MSNLCIFDPVNSSLNDTMLIEASAGTGKTYSLMHLLLRLIVEKRFSIERILIVTFTKNATAELRSRLQQILLQILDIFQDEGSWKEEVEILEDQTLKNQVKKWMNEDCLSAETIKDLVSEALGLFFNFSSCRYFCQKRSRTCSLYRKS